METGGKKITSVKFFECGYCVNNLKLVFKNHKKEIRNFPALVTLIKHKDFGYILYDTGYSKLVYKNHIISQIYNLMNKTYIDDNETITSQLSLDNISADEISKIILSHAHPDHIGALRLFSNYELISTQDVLDTISNNHLFDLVFKNMLPSENIIKKAVPEFNGDSFLKKYFSKVYDVLGDGSVLGVALDGHAKGQLGIFLPEHEILLAADACWGEDLLESISDMKFIAQRIQNNFKEYKATAEILLRLKKDYPNIKIVFSHSKER